MATSTSGTGGLSYILIILLSISVVVGLFVALNKAWKGSTSYRIFFLVSLVSVVIAFVLPGTLVASALFGSVLVVSIFLYGALGVTTALRYVRSLTTGS